MDENQTTFEKKIENLQTEYTEDINLIRLIKIHQEVEMLILNWKIRI